MMKTHFNILLSCVMVLLTACSAPIPMFKGAEVPMFEEPAELADPIKRDDTILFYTKDLNGRVIFLDPGHGGEDKKNSSKNKKVIEADINLKVAEYLKEFLESSGALVIMTREEDKSVDLKLRSVLANESGADIFISIHHNAPGDTSDYKTDYTSTYYHSSEENFNYEPCNRDLARYIQRDLAYAIRTSGGLGSFDGTYSDYWIYPKEGFSVLRNTTIPSVLIECAFHTSRLEEARLGYDKFNEIEAWGIYKGIAKYFRAGVPIIKYDSTLSIVSKEKSKFVFSFEDKSGIDEKSIMVYCDSSAVTFSYNKKINLLEVTPAALEEGEHNIRIIAANINKNYSFPYCKKIFVKQTQ